MLYGWIVQILLVQSRLHSRSYPPPNLIISTTPLEFRNSFKQP